MKTLKTAEDYFAKYELKYPTYNDEGILIQEDPTDCMGYDDFLKAFGERDNELITAIELKIAIAENWGQTITIEALTEVINLIKNDKK
jgi:hypothetical protein